MTAIECFHLHKHKAEPVARDDVDLRSGRPAVPGKDYISGIGKHSCRAVLSAAPQAFPPFSETEVLQSGRHHPFFSFFFPALPPLRLIRSSSHHSAFFPAGGGKQGSRSHGKKRRNVREKRSTLMDNTAAGGEDFSPLPVSCNKTVYLRTPPSFCQLISDCSQEGGKKQQRIHAQSPIQRAANPRMMERRIQKHPKQPLSQNGLSRDSRESSPCPCVSFFSVFTSFTADAS